MDFKNYVRMMLEADEAKDKNKKADDEDLDDEDLDDEDLDDEEDDDDEKSSIRTKKNGCTGCEATVKTKKNPVSDDDEDTARKSIKTNPVSDDDEDTARSSCKTKSLKEEMIYSSNYLNGKCSTLNEEREIIHVLNESIENHSASKFLAKQAKKAEREVEKYTRKGKREDAKSAKEVAKSLKEASDKLRKAEIEYKAGNPEAKIEYKKLCKEYSKILKKKGSTAKTIAAVTGAIAGAALLGTVGFTAMANDDIISRLEDGIKNDNLDKVIDSIKAKNSDALIHILNKVSDNSDINSEDGLAKTAYKKAAKVKEAVKDVKDVAWFDGHKDVEEAIKHPIKAYKTDKIYKNW